MKFLDPNNITPISLINFLPLYFKSESTLLQATHASAAAQKVVRLVLELAPDLPPILIGLPYIVDHNPR
jgi:hypothetical protein